MTAYCWTEQDIPSLYWQPPVHRVSPWPL